MWDIRNLLRPHLKQLRPYSSARHEYAGNVGIFLDANENPYGSVHGEKHHRYPDPGQHQLKEVIADIKGISTPHIFMGNGSDEAIDLLIRAFCEPGKDHILITPPTYGMYRVSADINDVRIAEAALTEDYQLDMYRMLHALQENPKIVFLCSPNNPTGNLLDLEDIHEVLDKATGLVVVDEAYIDFASRPSLIQSALDDHPNLVILQTFSKAWGLANFRLGMAFASPILINILNQIKPPYNVNGITQEVALKALSHVEEKDQVVANIIAQREWLMEELAQLPMVKHIFPSDANFLLIKVDEPDALYKKLIEEKIIVRNRSKLAQCEGCLRITVGSEEENQALITSLQKLSYV